jgi:hypothetical protein
MGITQCSSTSWLSAAAPSAETASVRTPRRLPPVVAQGRYVADRIAGAEFLSLDSDTHLICVSDFLDELAAAMTEFLERVLSEHLPSRLTPAS